MNPPNFLAQPAPIEEIAATSEIIVLNEESEVVSTPILCEACAEPCDEDGEAVCECRTCDACNRLHTNDNFCDNCDCCTGATVLAGRSGRHHNGCCDCFTCNSCDSQRSSDDFCSSCERCEGCCDCERCESCNSLCRELSCYDCSTCENCDCNCRNENECVNCHEEYDDEDFIECPSCHRCSDCSCECKGVSGKPFNARILPDYGEKKDLEFQESGRGLFKINKFKRFIGTEVEIALAKKSEPISAVLKELKYSAVEDGSLPGGTGFELLSQPANGDVFYNNMMKLGQALKEAEAEASPRCGLHVHLSSKDLNKYDLRKVIHLYGHLEPALFLLQPESRRKALPSGNWYSTPFVDKAIEIGEKPISDKFAVEKVLYGVSDRYWQNLEDTKLLLKEKYYDKKEKYLICLTARKAAAGKLKLAISREKTCHGHHSRYSSLNIHSHFYRGTLECRLHCGTADGDEIYNWSILLAQIIDTAKTMDSKLLFSLPLVSYHKTRNSAEWIREAIGPSWDTLVNAAGASLRPYIIERHKKFSK